MTAIITLNDNKYNSHVFKHLNDNCYQIINMSTIWRYIRDQWTLTVSFLITLFCSSWKISIMWYTPFRQNTIDMHKSRNIIL